MYEVGTVTIALVIVICIFILMLMALLCALSFFLGTIFTEREKKPPDNGNFSREKVLSEEDKQKLEKEKKELENFYSYTGEAQ